MALPHPTILKLMAYMPHTCVMNFLSSGYKRRLLFSILNLILLFKTVYFDKNQNEKHNGKYRWDKKEKEKTLNRGFYHFYTEN